MAVYKRWELSVLPGDILPLAQADCGSEVVAGAYR